MTEQVAFLSILITFAIIMLALLSQRLNRIERRICVLSSLEAKLDLVLKHSGLEYDPYKNLPPGVIESVQAGRKIEAIKRYRDETGADLKGAKEFIEEVQRRGALA
jgi:ribosomal protein L7/L12